MQITRSSIETQKGPADWFTGDVYIDAVATPVGSSTFAAALVHFTPGARTAWHTHPHGQTIMLALPACGGAGEDGEQTTAGPGASAPSIPSPAADEDAGASNGTPIRITFGDTALAARLDDTATARDLAAQLPLTLTFRDHNAVEKTAPLPRELSLDSAPGAHDPAAGDIGYWAPDADLVFYYDDEAPAFDGIVRIGQIDGDVEALNLRSGDLEATVERAP